MLYPDIRVIEECLAKLLYHLNSKILAVLESSDTVDGLNRAYVLKSQHVYFNQLTVEQLKSMLLH